MDRIHSSERLTIIIIYSTPETFTHRLVQLHNYVVLCTNRIHNDTTILYVFIIIYGCLISCSISFKKHGKYLI